MKRYNEFLLFILSILSVILIVFSAEAKEGARAGLLLAQNTIIPSLLPLLAVFYMIMKSGANDVLVRLFGTMCYRCFKLPRIAFSAILFGLLGGYPMGALLSESLFDDGEISERQAQRMLRFNFCGGAGFIITAVGSITLSSHRAGLILFFSNILSSLIILIISSFFEERDECTVPRIAPSLPFAQALTQSVSIGVKSVLNLSAFIILFSAIDGVIGFPKLLEPIIEITNGICSGTTFSLPITAALLSFGGFCVHFQLLGIISKVNMRYLDFLLFRIISAALSYLICAGLSLLFPAQEAVFSNISKPVSQLSSVNTALSVVMLLGSIVLVFDLHAKKRRI